MMSDYRIETPLRLVYILVAIFMLANSWNSSFAAYGIWTCAIFVLFLQGRHSNCWFLRLLEKFSVTTL